MQAKKEKPKYWRQVMHLQIGTYRYFIIGQWWRRRQYVLSASAEKSRPNAQTSNTHKHTHTPFASCNSFSRTRTQLQTKQNKTKHKIKKTNFRPIEWNCKWKEYERCDSNLWLNIPRDNWKISLKTRARAPGLMTAISIEMIREASNVGYAQITMNGLYKCKRAGGW